MKVMDSKLTLKLNESVIERAKQYASSKRLNLSREDEVTALKFKVENAMKRSLFILVVFLQLFVSCNKSSEDNGDMESEYLVVNDFNLANQLKSCPENVAINGNKYTLFTYLWRDFMPSSEPNGGSLMCVIKITGHNEENILYNPTSLSKIYVVYNHQIWISDTFEAHIFHDDDWEVVIRNGPKWGPNVAVDVICEFNNTGESYKLISKSQIINAIH